MLKKQRDFLFQDLFFFFFWWGKTSNNYNTILGILELHGQTAVTQKTVYLKLPGQGEDDLTDSFTKGNHHLNRENNIFKGFRKGKITACDLVSKSRLVLLDCEVWGLEWRKLKRNSRQIEWTWLDWKKMFSFLYWRRVWSIWSCCIVWLYLYIGKITILYRETPVGTWLTVMLNFHWEIAPSYSPSLGYCGSLLNGFHFVSQEDSCLFECELYCVPETECLRHVQLCLRLILIYHKNDNSNNKTTPPTYF